MLNLAKKLANSETILERPSTRHGRSSSSSTPLSESKNVNSQVIFYCVIKTYSVTIFGSSDLSENLDNMSKNGIFVIRKVQVVR